MTGVSIAGSGNPVGAAGGDLSGTYPDPSVAKINGEPLGSMAGLAAGMVLGWNGSDFVPVYPPGFALGYAQITNTVNITGTAENAQTTVLTMAAASFDGSAGFIEFFCGSVVLPTAAAGNSMLICLFESTNEQTRLGLVQTPSVTSQDQVPVFFKVPFTPAAGAHTYIVSASVSSTTGTPQVIAGSGSGAAYPPAWARWVKA